MLSQETVDEVWRPSVLYPMAPETMALFPSTHFSTYGLGWGLRDYRGSLLASHNGGIDGMLSQVVLVPEEKLGIVVLTNTSPKGALAHAAISYRILDAFLGAGSEVDWRARFRELGKKQDDKEKEAEEKRDRERVPHTSPSLPLGRFAGTYESDMYGKVLLAVEGGHLVLRRHTAWLGDLEHWHFDTFVARWRDRVMEKGLVTFRLGPDGSVQALELEEMGSFQRLP